VDVETHKNRQFTRTENALFVMAVLCVFGYFGNFAMKSSRKKEEAKRALREKREKRALKELHRRMSLRVRGDEDGGEREEEEEEEEEEDPFEGLTPEEIVQLKEKVENDYYERRRKEKL
jgi:flagellar biosynthesis/type III secretory pathway M-ring protein FliF/YscJ